MLPHMITKKKECMPHDYIVTWAQQFYLNRNRLHMKHEQFTMNGIQKAAANSRNCLYLGRFALNCQIGKPMTADIWKPACTFDRWPCMGEKSNQSEFCICLT